MCVCFFVIYIICYIKTMQVVFSTIINYTVHVVIMGWGWREGEINEGWRRVEEGGKWIRGGLEDGGWNGGCGVMRRNAA